MSLSPWGPPALSPVTESCVARESVYLVYGPRSNLADPGPGMVAPVWALTHCAHCAGERLARACNTRGDTGKDTRAERRPGQSKAEKSWAGNALFLGNSSELREQRDIAARGEGALQSAGKSLL